jgi:flagellar basal body-associated protein FliL
LIRARGAKIRNMRSLLPFILVFLGLFAAGCIAYIAWELSSEDDKPESKDN